MEKDEIAHVEEAESGNNDTVQEDGPDANMNLQAYLALAVCTCIDEGLLLQTLMDHVGRVLAVCGLRTNITHAVHDRLLHQCRLGSGSELHLDQCVLECRSVRYG